MSNSGVFVNKTTGTPIWGGNSGRLCYVKAGSGYMVPQLYGRKKPVIYNQTKDSYSGNLYVRSTNCLCMTQKVNTEPTTKSVTSYGRWVPSRGSFRFPMMASANLSTVDASEFFSTTSLDSLGNRCFLQIETNSLNGSYVCVYTWAAFECPSSTAGFTDYASDIVLSDSAGQVNLNSTSDTYVDFDRSTSSSIDIGNSKQLRTLANYRCFPKPSKLYIHVHTPIADVASSASLSCKGWGIVVHSSTSKVTF